MPYNIDRLPELRRFSGTIGFFATQNVDGRYDTVVDEALVTASITPTEYDSISNALPTRHGFFQREDGQHWVSAKVSPADFDRFMNALATLRPQ